jgi:hypothetical protein
MNAARQLAAHPTRKAAGFTGRLPCCQAGQASQPPGRTDKVKERRQMTGKLEGMTLPVDAGALIK